jgi:hypothetical protein
MPHSAAKEAHTTDIRLSMLVAARDEQCPTSFAPDRYSGAGSYRTNQVIAEGALTVLADPRSLQVNLLSEPF